jgi:hypothetical protein
MREFVRRRLRDVPHTGRTRAAVYGPVQRPDAPPDVGLAHPRKSRTRVGRSGNVTPAGQHPKPAGQTPPQQRRAIIAIGKGRNSPGHRHTLNKPASVRTARELLEGPRPRKSRNSLSGLRARRDLGGGHRQIIAQCSVISETTRSTEPSATGRGASLQAPPSGTNAGPPCAAALCIRSSANVRERADRSTATGKSRNVVDWPLHSRLRAGAGNQLRQKSPVRALTGRRRYVEEDRWAAGRGIEGFMSLQDGT